MNDPMNPNDPPSRIDRYFDEMKAMFRELSTRHDALKDSITRLQADMAPKDMVRTVQDQMRAHVESQNQAQTKVMVSTVNDKIAAARADAAREVATQMRTMLQNWMETDFMPAVAKAVEDIREAETQKRRQAMRFVVYIVTGSLSVGGMLTGVLLYFLSN